MTQAMQRVADTFATGATSLESQRMGALTSAFGSTNQNVNDLLQSLFTGQASANQLGLAQNPPRQKILGLF